MIVGPYITGACRGDTLKGKLSPVRYSFNNYSHNYGTEYRV